MNGKNNYEGTGRQGKTNGLLKTMEALKFLGKNMIQKYISHVSTNTCHFKLFNRWYILCINLKNKFINIFPQSKKEFQ